ncbi:hypothetical protein FJ651_11000 [Paucihalobacter ruber]|uniref:Uncharacterized protein n=1 Tax=Paucihalobacter ruber TaxID=2567861 RepID=A0A506PKD2_9FLAO|nr:DUF6090 family protein [Paucihalobacter ruber]TPV32830.1 hypothetical protein FJ651_11000 [Paucihalobacter ruber]
METGKTGRYLKYAIGEIFLVVIGILIALQINNWNEANKATKEELKILKEMQFNLTNDLKDCEWNINKQQELASSNAIVLNHLEQATPFNDSLRYHYGNLIYSTTQRRNMAAYDHLKAKGIDLIQNDSLRRHITAVYSERYYFIEKQELEYDNQIQLNELLPQLNAKLIYDNLSRTGYPIKLLSLQNDDVFKGTLRMNVNARKYMKLRYEGLLTDLKNLIAHIDEELKERTR